MKEKPPSTPITPELSDADVLSSVNKIAAGLDPEWKEFFAPPEVRQRVVASVRTQIEISKKAGLHVVVVRLITKTMELEKRMALVQELYPKYVALMERQGVPAAKIKKLEEFDKAALGARSVFHQISIMFERKIEIGSRVKNSSGEVFTVKGVTPHGFLMFEERTPARPDDYLLVK